MADFSSFFESSNEKQLAVLGEEYADKVLRDSGGLDVKKIIGMTLALFGCAVGFLITAYGTLDNGGRGGLSPFIFIEAILGIVLISVTLRDKKKGICVISSDRVYGKGWSYYKSGLGWKQSNRTVTIDNNEIISASIVDLSITTPFQRIFLTIVGILAFIGMYYMTTLMGHAWTYAEKITYSIPRWLGIIYLVIVIFFTYIKKAKVFVVTYPGSQLAFRASNYSDSDIQTFLNVVNQIVSINTQEHNDTKQARETYTEQTNFVPSEAADFSVQSGASENTVAELKKYKELLDSGAITQEEFDNFKSQLL